MKHVEQEAVKLIQKYILESVIDPETKRVCYDHMSLDYEQYKAKITDYLTATQKSRGDKMDLGWMDGSAQARGERPWGEVVQAAIRV